jgi:pimeloyl-ACP methyl ester carboxylesterase
VTRLSHYRHGDLTFDVLDEGPLDGEPVVLLHGFPQRSTCWRLVAPLLHAAGLRTYAPDQRGYSRGARPGRRRDYRLSHLVDDVVALADAIGGPVHLVGHDWGAAVAWALAGQHPERVRTLTAVSVPHPAAFLRAMATSAQALRSWYMAAFQLPVLPELLGASSLAEGRLREMGMDEEQRRRFRTEIVEDGALTGGLMWYRAVPLVDPRHVTGTVRVPTTFVWSDGDPAIARAGGLQTQDYVDAPYEYVELNGVSHWIPEEAPQALATAVLARVAAVPTP